LATEFLVPNGDDGGWDAGGWADVDNGGIAPSSPGGGPTDSALVTISGTSKEGITMDFDLTPSAVVDGDTVTEVDVHIRAQNNGGGGSDEVAVDLLIGGIPVGSQYLTGTLTGSFANYTANGTTQSWTVDWSEAQMDGMQVRITSSQAGMPAALATEVSEIEVVVSYTETAGTVPFSTRPLLNMGVGR